MIGTYPTIASTQYNDACGTVAGDFVDGGASTLTDLLASKGFDTNTYFPYSVQLVFGELNDNSTRRTWMVVEAVKKDEVGESVASVITYAREHDRVVPTHRFSFDMPQSEFFRMFKRFVIDIGYHSKDRHQYTETIFPKVMRESVL